jgi:hypothetical protein
MQDITGEETIMWGDHIGGFGSYRIKMLVGVRENGFSWVRNPDTKPDAGHHVRFSFL